MNAILAMGLMSGTSLDGIDVALLRTDGQTFAEPMGSIYYPYQEDFRDQLRSLLGQKERTSHLKKVEEELTLLHGEAVNAFFKQYPAYKEYVKLIGFHGQTIFHVPRHMQEGHFIPAQSLQIGDGPLLAQKTGIPVVYNMRQNDIYHGGEGAPLVPIYHQVIVRHLPKPVAVLNIGGVSNVTWIGEDQLLAYDMGPGNALLNDWVLSTCNKPYDAEGVMARKGAVDASCVNAFLLHPFFKKKPPKSLDRQTFSLSFDKISLSAEEGAATLTEMTVMAIKKGMEYFPYPPKAFYVVGGGVHNLYLMERLSEVLSPIPLYPIADLGHGSDFIEAEAWAFLAVRSKAGLPLTFPRTTGVSHPVTGGVIVTP